MAFEELSEPALELRRFFAGLQFGDFKRPLEEQAAVRLESRRGCDGTP